MVQLNIICYNGLFVIVVGQYCVGGLPKFGFLPICKFPHDIARYVILLRNNK